MLRKTIQASSWRARSLIGYHHGCAFQFYYQWVAKNGETNEKAWYYLAVKATFRKQFGLQRYLQRSIKDALSLKQHGKQTAHDFALKAGKSYKEAEFTIEQKFFFLSEAVVINEQIQNFIILKAPSFLHELMSVRQAYNKSCSRFQQSGRVDIATTAQDVQSFSSSSQQRAEQHKVSRESDPAVENLCA